MDERMTVDDTSPVGPVENARRAQLRRRLLGTAPTPQRLGRFAVSGVLGQGGMGVVLRARDETLGRPVALKLLHGQFTGTRRKRLVREAQALARLSHPNVVQLYEAGEIEGRLFIAMELCPGQTLQDWQQLPRPWVRCVEVYLQAGRGLAAAHARGLIHRDFKPGNCILGDDGRVRVLDFGLARGLQSREPSTEAALEEPGLDVLLSDVTRTGARLGTPAYMSPEQGRGRAIDPTSDQYSFCVSLYEAIHGHRPTSDESVSSTSARPESGDGRPLPVRLPARLRRALRRGLRTDPGDRWPSMDPLLAELEHVLHPRRYERIALGLGGLCVVAAVAGPWARTDEAQPCSGSQQHMDGVWNDAARRRLDDSAWDRDPARGPATRARVDALLDDYTRTWAEAHTRACEDTTVRGDQPTAVMDRRMACLDERRSALAEGLDVLAVLEDGSKAVDLALSLPSVRPCDDIEALSAGRPPPEDPRHAAELTRLRQRLARSRMLSSAGRLGPALTLAQSVVTDAEALEHPLLLAEALLRRGSARRDEGRFDQAADDLQQAYLAALSAGDEPVATSAASRSALVAIDRQEPEPTLRHWAAAASATAQRVSVPPLIEAEALVAVGKVHGTLDEYDTAIARLEDARSIYERELGPEHPRVADRLSDIGEQLSKQERFDESLAHHRRALALLRRSVGPVHPSVATSLNNHAGVFFHLEREHDAARVYREVLSIREQLFGPDHPSVAETAIYLGNTLHSLGDYEHALEQHLRAESIMRTTFGDEHVSLGGVLYTIAKDHLGLGHPDEAATVLWRAAALDPGNYTMLYELAQLELTRGRADEALRAARMVREAARTWTRHADAVPVADFVLARALWLDPAQRERAVALAVDAAAALESIDGPGADAPRHRRRIAQWLSTRAPDIALGTAEASGPEGS